MALVNKMVKNYMKDSRTMYVPLTFSQSGNFH